MTKKTVLVSLLAIPILAGTVLILSGRGILDNSLIAPLFKPAYSSAGQAVIKVTEPQSEDARPGKQLPKQQKGVTDKISLSVALNNNRAERWQRAKKGAMLEQRFIELLSDGDLESPRFAMHIQHMCLRAKKYQEGSNLVTKENLREYMKWVNPEMSDASIANILLLNSKFSARCGDLGNFSYNDVTFEVFQKARVAGSVLLAAPSSSKIDSETELTALNSVLRSPELAAVWLAARHLLFTKAAESAGYFVGLNGSERDAVTWTAICNFGGDCADDGLTRLDACLTSYLCGGNSVAEAVADAVGKDKVQTIAARANKLGLDLAVAGSDFFKSRPK
jgi:hypothetical protein